MTEQVLVIAAHADDEVLGCGGTIARHIHAGDQVAVLFMTDGVSSRANTALDPGELVHGDKEQRLSASQQALKILGVTDIRQLNFPDNKMDTIALLDVVQAIEPVIAQLQPQTIYCHFAHDLNIDHRITHQAVMTACRPQVGGSVKKILSFEVLSSTEWNSPAQPAFLAQYIVDISPFWPQKLAALQCYDQEMRAFPHSRSYQCVEALATLRGATHGFDKAEAFLVERILES